MLRVFSSIRHSLLNENKSVKYLKYAVGEILLIMIGIFLGLQLNDWNEERKDRIEERNILMQLKAELETTIEFLVDRNIPLAQSYIQDLNQVEAVFQGGSISNDKEFLDLVAHGARMSWGQPDIPKAVYDELVSSGKLRMIENTQLRLAITELYKFALENRERGDARRAGYGPLAYELIPRHSGGIHNGENRVREGLNDDEYARITQAVLASDLQRHITPLQNRYQMIETTWLSLLDSAEELIAEIEAELDK